MTPSGRPLRLAVAAACLAASSVTRTASSLSFRPTPAGAVNLSSAAERDVYGMSEWASSYGVQQAKGLQLMSFDRKDYFPVTQADVPGGSPVMYVPSDLCLSSSKARAEFGASLADCESKLVEGGLEGKVPLFRLFFKILSEYQNGESSPWHPWLNSLPRIYNTGASMTYACFDCLPPYAGTCEPVVGRAVASCFASPPRL